MFNSVIVRIINTIVQMNETRAPQNVGSDKSFGKFLIISSFRNIDIFFFYLCNNVI